MEFITSKNNRLLNAKKSKQGHVKIDESDNLCISGTPFICVKTRNKWGWKHLHKISGATWVENRDLIRDSIIKTHKDINLKYLNWQKLLISSDEENRKKNQEIKFLFNKLPEYVKNEYLKKFDNPGIKFMHCKVCNDICDLTKKTCIHEDCCGMCNNCHISWKNSDVSKKKMFVFGSPKNDIHTCPACNKSQLMECPICYDNKLKSEMIKSDSCSHSICCNCFSRSFKSNPIVECPMCRAQFNNTLIKQPPEPAFNGNQILN